MIVTYEGTEYAFDFNEIRVKHLIRIKRVYGITLADLQVKFRSGRGTISTCLYWLVLMQNGSKLPLELAVCKPSKLVMSVHQAEQELLRTAELLASPPERVKLHGKTEADQSWIDRRDNMATQKASDLAKFAKQADISQLFVEYMVDFAANLHMSPGQVEELRWTEFFSLLIALKDMREEARKQQAEYEANKPAQSAGGFKV